LSAIDTGTTLIGGPTADVQAFWAAIPNSGPSPSGQGFFNFRTHFPLFHVSLDYMC
jgi:cathepsin D